MVPVAVVEPLAIRRRLAARLGRGALVISIAIERVVPGEYPSLPGREIVVPGASGEVAVSCDRRSAVPERVVPIHDGDHRLNLIALVAVGALGGILHSAFGARAMAAERVQGVRTHPRKETWMRSQ
jgi:hypothetical protein